jgi:cytochrome bd-type quinol oxidase subunit 2
MTDYQLFAASIVVGFILGMVVASFIDGRTNGISER